MADKIRECFLKLQTTYPDKLGNKLVRRSMGLFDKLGEKPTYKIRDEDWDPENDHKWKEFRERFAENNELPSSKFDGKLIDGRSKGPSHKTDRNVEKKIIALLKNGIPVADIIQATNSSKSVIYRIRRNNLITTTLHTGPWNNASTDPKNRMTWAMADQIKTYFDILKNKEPDIAAWRLLRSMGLYEELSPDAASSIIKNIKQNNWDPSQNEAWLYFKQRYVEEGLALPSVKFSGEIIDARFNQFWGVD